MGRGACNVVKMGIGACGSHRSRMCHTVSLHGQSAEFGSLVLRSSRAGPEQMAMAAVSLSDILTMSHRSLCHDMSE